MERLIEWYNEPATKDFYEGIFVGWITSAILFVGILLIQMIKP